MPHYDITLSDGRVVSFDSNRLLSKDEAENEAYAAIGHGTRLPEAKEPGVFEGIGNTVKNAAVGAYNMVTGADRQTPETRNLPENNLPLAPTIGGRLKTMGGFLTATDDKQRKQILQENYPGVSFRQDAKGNEIINYQGKESVLNKPGLSQEDIIPAAAQGVAFTKAAIGGSALLKPFIGRALGAGAGAAATSVGLDVAANQAGAKKGAIDMAKSAGVAGAFGTLAEAAAPFAGWLVQKMRGQQIVNGAGAITEEAKTAMRGAGINPDDLSDEFVTMLRNYSQRIDDPAAAARLSQGQSLPVPVTQTRGQLTMDPQSQRLEEAMRAGSYGDTAGQRMRGVAADQQGQIGQNLEVIQGQMSGGRRQVVTPGQGGEAVSAKLNQMRDAEKAGVDTAYEAARNADPAFIQGAAADVGVQRVTAAVTQGHSLRAVPKVSAELDDLARLVPDDVTPASIKDLYQWRQRMSSIRADGGQEAQAAGAAIKEFDRFINDAVDKALMSGDEAAIGLWRDAISKNRQFADRFKGDDLVGKLTQRVYDTNSRTLAVDPTSAANYILGRSKMGPAGKMNIVPDMKKLRNVLGADSPEWNSLREEVFMRFSRAGEGASPAGAQQFSGVNFKTNWNNAWKTDEPLMSQLFTQKERQLIDQFADVAARVTSQTKYGSNPSGTSYAMFDLAKRIPFVGRALSRYGIEMQGMSNSSQALKVPYREVPAGYLGGAGGTVGSRDY